MIFLGSMIFIAGALIGAFAVDAWKTAILELSKIEHTKQMNEIFEEVKRLRTQVASLIGKE
jgi:hypothetical protein